jgi:hypothetical protein
VLQCFLRKEQKSQKKRHTETDTSPHNDTKAAHVENKKSFGVSTIFKHGRFVCSSFKPFTEHPSSPPPHLTSGEKILSRQYKFLHKKKRKERDADKSILSSPVMCIVRQEGMKFGVGVGSRLQAVTDTKPASRTVHARAEKAKLLRSTQ